MATYFNNGLNADTLGVQTLLSDGSFTGSTVNQHNVVIGSALNLLDNVAPSATAGIPLVSNGAAADPSFSAASVPGGGTGKTSLTAHGVLVGEGTSAIVATAAGSNGQVLLGSTGADPAFAALTSTGSTLSYTTGAAALNIDITAPVVVSYGGTGKTSLTAYAPVCGGTTATGALQQATTGFGSAGTVLTSNGSSALPSWQSVSSGGVQVNMQTFTSSGTYTPTAGMVYCIIEVVGGGGGGGGGGSTGGTNSATGGGGGAGGYARGVFSAATIGASKAVTIGSAGSGGGPGSNGTTGGTTSVGSTLIQATGGSPGGGGAAAGAGGAGGLGGVGSLGSINAHGNAGGKGASTGASIAIAGAGAGSFFGGGPAQQMQSGSTSTNGQSATVYGAGGGGGCNAGLGNSSSGGNGSAGIVVITEFIA